MTLTYELDLVLLLGNNALNFNQDEPYCQVSTTDVILCYSPYTQTHTYSRPNALPGPQRWLGSLVVRAADLRLNGREFDPRPPH